MIAKPALNSAVVKSEPSPQSAHRGAAGPVRAAGGADVRKIESAGKAEHGANTAAAAPAAESRYSSDVASFSEDANIDLSLFSYFYKGGVAGEALTENKSGGGDFKPEPNFTGISATRYSQMKSEIERNFAENPDLKNKYLRELDKTLEDYIRMQSKYASEREEEAENADNEDTRELGQEKLDKLMSILGAGSKEVAAIIQKVLGNTESAMPEALSKVVDDYFVDIFRQKMSSAEKPAANQKLEAFNREVKEDPRTKSMWNSVRVHIDNDD